MKRILLLGGMALAAAVGCEREEVTYAPLPTYDQTRAFAPAFTSAGPGENWTDVAMAQWALAERAADLAGHQARALAGDFKRGAQAAAQDVRTEAAQIEAGTEATLREAKAAAAEIAAGARRGVAAWGERADRAGHAVERAAREATLPGGPAMPAPPMQADWYVTPADRYLAEGLRQQFADDEALASVADQIQIHVNHGQVVLAGVVASTRLRDAFLACAKAFVGQDAVMDQLDVR